MRKTKHVGYRPTWAEVNLGNIAHNFNQIKKTLSGGTKVMVTVKADAYGHGLIPVSRKLVSCGADYLGVASIDEGIKLREAGIKLPILVLGMILKNDTGPLFRYSLTPTVCTTELALALDKKGRSLKKKINVHIKIDTGMGRLGILHDDALELINKVHKLKSINIEGLFTHFAVADMDRDFTFYQIDLFNRLLTKLHKKGIHIPLLHAANSMGIVGYKDSHFNMVRPGLVIYGLYPKKNLKINLKPVLSLKTKAIYIKKVPYGHGISYGHEYITRKVTRIATLPIGYGDGYPRNLSNQAPVLIKGKRFKISGRICMDQIMIDVGKQAVKVGDEVVLIGSQGKNKVTAEELARLSGTIPYEIVCGLGSRIPRVYI
ncbi:MAG: alanine racemase [Candidatus Omnitrophica bacterium]|nr:alanine racemase [Candidatus Omnitrophota bacterium]